MRALVTGINGMDGSYMADKLLKEGWEVLDWNEEHLIKIELIQST